MEKKHNFPSSFMFFDILWHSLTISVSARCSKRSISIFRERFNSSREALQVTSSHRMATMATRMATRNGAGFFPWAPNLRRFKRPPISSCCLWRNLECTEVVRWCEILWDVNFGDVNKIEQVKHVKRYFKTKMCQDVPRCSKTPTVLPSQLFELRVSPRERETL